MRHIRNYENIAPCFVKIGYFCGFSLDSYWFQYVNFVGGHSSYNLIEIEGNS